jgi:hypothetical protein
MQTRRSISPRRSRANYTLIKLMRVAMPSTGQPDYIGGVRGLVERNTMRYYLAIDAYLSTLPVRPEKRLD